MKRLIALILACMLVMTLVTGCGTKKEETPS
ncbi:MAG: hypothetical protein H6Q59_1479, partial [Firmicutes bacterium]|nr:hypothetical protein [Bacillota bacterium]